MKPVSLRAISLCLALSLAACDGDGPYRQSMEAKRPYSVLQSEEARLRQSAGRYRYVFTRRALGTDYDVLALPSRNQGGHYVAIIANAAEPDRVLTVPSGAEHRPLITPDTLNELASRGFLSEASQAYLAGQTTDE